MLGHITVTLYAVEEVEGWGASPLLNYKTLHSNLGLVIENLGPTLSVPSLLDYCIAGNFEEDNNFTVILDFTTASKYHCSKSCYDI